ncbi:MAG TPA: TadE/TadG family type IV pilus assembly protein [Blastocatellia bacterium]|nr:TadE/TadG family type IV pilus assembly protein [Blastocatellia bacterium]
MRRHLREKSLDVRPEGYTVSLVAGAPGALIRGRHPRRASGQTLIEMALLTPFLALILAAILHFGAALNAHHVITNAAREGARAGTQADGDAARMRQVITTVCRNANLDLSRLTIDVDPGTPGNPTRATVTYRYTSPLNSFFRTTGLILRAEAVMRK